MNPFQRISARLLPITAAGALVLALATLSMACNGCSQSKPEGGAAGGGGATGAGASDPTKPGSKSNEISPQESGKPAPNATPAKPGTDGSTPTGNAGTATAAPIDPATTGSIRGIVKYTKAAPARDPILMTSECVHGAKTPVNKEDLIVSPDGAIQNVFVYIKDGLGGRTFPVPETPVELDQLGCVYIPHVFGAQVGQQLIIKNSDGTTHNVNYPGGRNPGFNKAMLPGSDPLKARFKQPEVKRIFKCDIHPWMSSYGHFLTHPFFFVTKADGKFELKGLPPGKYVVEAIHESLGTATVEVNLEAKGEGTADFLFGK